MTDVQSELSASTSKLSHLFDLSFQKDATFDVSFDFIPSMATFPRATSSLSVVKIC